MATKGYSTFPKAPGLKPHHQMQFSVIPRTIINHSWLIYILCLYRAVVGMLFLVVQHFYVHVKGSMGECHWWFCSACCVHLTWMVLEIGGRWPYTCCFMGYYFLDLFSFACNILEPLLSSFFTICFVSIRVVNLYSRIDTTTARKKSQPINISSRLHLAHIDVTFSRWDVVTKEHKFVL